MLPDLDVIIQALLQAAHVLHIHTDLVEVFIALTSEVMAPVAAVAVNSRAANASLLTHYLAWKAGGR